MCNAENPQLCAACGSSAYCSKKCQKEDWVLHKELCKGYRLFHVLRPDKNHRIAILFPVDSQSPRLVWVKIEAKAEQKEVAGGSNANYRIIEMSLLADVILVPLLGEEGRKTTKIISEFNIAHGFHLIHQIEIIRCENHKTENVNKSISVATKGKPGKYLEGPAVVTRRLYLEDAKDDKKPAEGTTEIRLARGEQYEDMTLADLRHAVDLFLAFPAEEAKAIAEIGVE
ncbi:hypothetical protein N431DRAFT_396424 [Stipitochalara longipes BDJ]|nr:hypothetical protein N431DRAFT_396424 [Stipitochalara longipes BDJ]